ncbi:DUF3888 domain-containing protein [Bacillus sp. ISL-35]|uniref:DUF3888 domain-containing protein n=1 Tax=Bacillus sp. ISL-35 TaxID=2819122 RepID=UPI001BE8D0C8|nr:DUF3888 domain-containing protein [Bacillus sp. ISL-35]MBT2680068.1 DUF3888 domain-containing protein [Bacillus sp. ISL-35]MBT2702955.1 DUF3888 domain-containing protein [Chryseobacterium sp. ISL-80]
MKKLLVFLALIMVICVSNVSAQSYQKHKHDSKGMEQVMDHFLLDQFHDEIAQALKGYYKNESIRIQYNWWDKNYDVVEIDQWEKGNELSHPYIVKFTIQSYGEEGQLGTDTITFGASPELFNKGYNDKNLAAVNVDFIDFKHREAKAKK